MLDTSATPDATAQQEDRGDAIRRQIEQQNAAFPQTLEHCKTIDFHFNRGSLEHPDLPTWILKAKGRTYYIRHFHSEAPFDTRETPEGSTRGMLRFRDCDLALLPDGTASIASTPS
ncbi:MAG: hypothetical protein ACRYGR_05980 [Janthinobacterium lividum]